MSLKNLEKISEEIHRTRGTNMGVITPPGPREPGVGATDDDDFNDPESCDDVKCDTDMNKVRNLNNLPIADIMNQMEMDNSAETASLDTNSIFSEDKDDDDYITSSDDMKRNLFRNSNSMTTNSRNEVIDSANADSHELNLEELRQKVKLLAVRPVEGSDGQTKDCWETELNETVNKLDRLMMLHENNARDNVPNRPIINSINAESVPSPSPIPTPTPTPISQPSSISNADLLASKIHSLTHCSDTINNSISRNTQQSTSSTKAFLNNSLQAVQQKMEDLLPNGSQSSVMKELPLLSRISNEISANTANTVKVLKRRLSLN